MAKKSLEVLTESMFYVLMAFRNGEKCGIDVAAFVDRKTKGRVKIGPGTLYTILAKFEEEGFLRETAVEGRKRTYRLTLRGSEAYQEELDRLRQCVVDGEGETHEDQA